MNSLNEIDNLTKETQKREFDDGLVDILYGLVFFVVGAGVWLFLSGQGLEWLANALVRNREATIIVLVALVALLLLAIVGIRRTIARIRITYLWKGQGYVEPLRWQVKTSISVLAVLFAVGMIIVAMFLRMSGLLGADAVLRAMVAAVSAGTAITYLGVGLDLRIRRYIGVGIAGLFLSGPVLVGAGSFAEAWLLFGIGWLIILSISGLWAFRKTALKLSESTSE